MIIYNNERVHRTIQHLNNNYNREQTVCIHIHEDSTCVESPDGEMGFAVFDTEKQSIHVAADIPDAEINVPAMIAHEYMHFLQWCDGREYDEEEADRFAEQVMEELGIFEAEEEPRYLTLEHHMYHFNFSTDGPLTQEEKMMIADKGVHALENVLQDVVGKRADHNMSFGFDN